MGGIGPDEIAEDLLDAEDLYELGEWAAIEDLAVELLDEARSAFIDPRVDAAGRLVTLVARMDDDRVDPATAAALVYIGRIGYD